MAEDNNIYNGGEFDEVTSTARRRNFMNATPEYVDFSVARDYITARNRFQKGYTSISGDPGYFYFKLLFDFKRSPLLKNLGERKTKEDKPSLISAANFLHNNQGRLNCASRYKALKKFQKLLYFTVNETPWVFRKVTDLGQALYTDLKKPGEGARQLKIQCAEEFTDFRLSLLMDLYRYICFDYRNQRVIVPENLRKFNMSVLFFTVPLKWIHTPIKAPHQATAQVFKKSDNPDYKRIKGNRNEENVKPLTVRMVHFTDCEFSDKSMLNIFDQGDSTQPTQTAPTFEITYNRAFTEDISEWFNVTISELKQYYFDPNAPATPALKNKKTNSLKNMIQSEIDNIKSAFSSFGDMLKGGGDSSDSARWKYYKSQYLYGGGGGLGDKLLGIAESAIDNVANALNNYVGLGNIYDESWLANAKGFLTADGPRAMISSLVKGGMSVAAKATGSSLLAQFANNGIVGGLQGIADASSRGAGQFLTGKGMPQEVADMWTKWEKEHRDNLNRNYGDTRSVAYQLSRPSTLAVYGSSGKMYVDPPAKRHSVLQAYGLIPNIFPDRYDPYDDKKKTFQDTAFLSLVPVADENSHVYRRPQYTYSSSNVLINNSKNIFSAER